MEKHNTKRRHRSGDRSTWLSGYERAGYSGQTIFWVWISRDNWNKLFLKMYKLRREGDLSMDTSESKSWIELTSYAVDKKYWRTRVWMIHDGRMTQIVTMQNPRVTVEVSVCNLWNVWLWVLRWPIEWSRQTSCYKQEWNSVCKKWFIAKLQGSSATEIINL